MPSSSPLSFPQNLIAKLPQPLARYAEAGFRLFSGKSARLGYLAALEQGKEIPLPDGHHFHDRYGTRRHHIRIRWWDRQETTYRGKFLGAREWETHIPDDPIQGDHGIEYGHHEPPVFLGHYWLEGTPAPLESNVACLDYSVAKRGGRLTAYRWDGEQVLERDRFVWVERVEEKG